MSTVLTNAIIGIIIGGLASAFGAFMGWISSNDPFIARKFVTGILTGTVAGILVGFGSAPVFAEIESDLALLIVYGEIFGTALAATFLVPKISHAINTRVTGTADTEAHPINPPS
ncbi:hypothetical protein [Serratia sp. (in: enterobacteria)]|uniref:hypothetical protein n=1 Tax=Serratia sp. (in: enterobacteria) TaxID=616 RepID=UPI003988B35D